VDGQVTSNPIRFNAALNRGLAGFDIRHVLVLSNVWNIPGRTHYRLVNAVVTGWSLADIFTVHSGLPFSVFLGNDNENIGTVGGRSTEFPDLVGSLAVAHRNPYQWFTQSHQLAVAAKRPASGQRNL
jgi:hypothetical protein